jgi:DeoR/GlpR family transcriptional regulator of sugar metabolism
VEVPEDAVPFGVMVAERPRSRLSPEVTQERRARIMQLLAGGGMWTTAQIAQQLDENVIAIRNDMSRMQQKGLPIKSKNGRGYWLAREESPFETTDRLLVNTIREMKHATMADLMERTGLAYDKVRAGLDRATRQGAIEGSGGGKGRGNKMVYVALNNEGGSP